MEYKKVSIFDSFAFGFRTFFKYLHVILLMLLAITIVFSAVGAATFLIVYFLGDVQNPAIEMIVTVIVSIVNILAGVFFSLGLYKLGLVVFDTGKGTFENLLNFSYKQVIRYIIAAFVFMLFVQAWFYYLSPPKQAQEFFDQIKNGQGFYAITVSAVILYILGKLIHARFGFFAQSIIDDKNQSLIGSFKQSYHLTIGYMIQTFVFFIIMTFPLVFIEMYKIDNKILEISIMVLVVIYSCIGSLAQSHLYRQLQKAK